MCVRLCVFVCAFVFLCFAVFALSPFVCSVVLLFMVCVSDVVGHNRTLDYMKTRLILIYSTNLT